MSDFDVKDAEQTIEEPAETPEAPRVVDGAAQPQGQAEDGDSAEQPEPKEGRPA
jgi:hypothetical protein